MEIHISVRKKIATQTDNTILVCDNTDITAVFDFDEEWEEHDVKTVRVRWVSNYVGYYSDVLMSGNSCVLPPISNTFSATIGVYADNVSTTSPAVVKALPSILSPEGAPVEPTEDVYNQIIELVNSIATAAQPKSLSMTIPGLSASTVEGALTELFSEKANVDGYYGESGGVFQYSTNFLGKNTPQNASNVVFRPTASQMSGQSWSADSISGQTATIDKIKGKTLVFNQLSRYQGNFSSLTVNGITVTKNADTSITISGTATSDAAFGISVFIRATFLRGHKYLIRLNDTAISGLHFGITGYGYGSTESTIQIIRPASSDSDWSGNIQFTVDGGTTISAKVYPMLIDLTQMYGAGNEPQTVKEFKAQFPLDYYAYNTGELISLNATGLKTVGFNQLYSDGHIDVLKGLTYKIEGTYTSLKDSAGNDVAVTNGEFIPTANDTYTMVGGSCVHLKWSGVRDGETEEHWDSTLSLPIADYFPDGMKSAGTVYDELTKDKAVKRIGKVDLGTLNWDALETTESGKSRFSATAPSGTKPAISGTDIANIRCSLMEATGSTRTFQALNGISLTANANPYIRFYHEPFASYNATQVKQALSGVYLYYELAEPVETPISPPLNLTYRCDDFGTEMILPQNGDEPATAPLDADIVYQLDYEANVRNMPVSTISKESMDAFIAAFNASGLGTITQTWDAANGRYAYTIVPSAQEG